MIGIADNGNLILASTVSRFDDVLWEFDTTNNQLNLIRVNNETVLPESLDLESYRNPGFDDPKAGSNYKHTSNGDISISLASPFRVILLGRARQGNPYTDSSVLGTSAIRAVVAARPLGVDDLITFDAIGFDHAIDDDLNIILYGRNPQSIDANNAGIFLISPDGSIDKILDQDAVVETSGNINPRLTDSVSILAPGSDVAGSTTFFTPFNDAGFLMQTRMGLFLLTR